MRKKKHSITIHYVGMEIMAFRNLLCTDLGSLIGNHNVDMIFLPLRFYVKSILFILKLQTLPFWPYEQLWILNFWIFFKYQMWNSQNINNQQPPKLLQWASEITKTLFHVKSKWQENGRISTLWKINSQNSQLVCPGL